MDKRPQPELIEVYAAECRRIANLAPDREIRLTYLQLADSWQELAGLRRRIEADKPRKRQLQVGNRKIGDVPKFKFLLADELSEEEL